MTEQEVESGNNKIELHNKFCFMKKKLPKYRKIVPLSEPLIYIMVTACLVALPVILGNTSSGIFMPSNQSAISCSFDTELVVKTCK